MTDTTLDTAATGTEKPASAGFSRRNAIALGHRQHQLFAGNAGFAQLLAHVERHRIIQHRLQA